MNDLEETNIHIDRLIECIKSQNETQGNDNYESILYGVYSTEQLAREAAEELLELGNIHHYEIECPKLDEFGWR